MEAQPEPDLEDYMREELSAKLHAIVAETTVSLRQELNDAEIGSSFNMSIDVSGRVAGGDVIVKYSVSGLYGSKVTEGSRLAPVLSEFMRRNGWEKRNAPLALPAPGEPLEEPVAQDNEPVEAPAALTAF